MDLVKFEEVANDYNVARAAFDPARNALIALVWDFIEKTTALTGTFDYKFRNENIPELSKYMGLTSVKLYFFSSINDSDFYVDVEARKVYIEAYADLDYCENFTFEELANAEKTLTDAYAAWVKKASKAEAKEASKAEALAAKKALAAYNKFKEKGYYAS